MVHNRLPIYILASGSLHVGLVVFLLLIAKLNFNSAVSPVEMAFTEIKIHDLVAAKRKVGALKKEVLPPQEKIIEKSPDVVKGAPQNIQKENTMLAVPSAPLGADTKHAFVDEYTRELIFLIQKRNVFPRLAQKMGHTGQVLVRLRVAKDGHIIESKILEKSAFSTLNEAAEKLIAGLPKLRPFPEGISENEWIFNIPIDYKI